MFNTKDFWFKTFSKTVESAETCDTEEFTVDSLVILINVEKEDEIQKDIIVKKAVNNISWLAKKNDRKKVVLHSFGHLSECKSSIEFADDAIKAIKDKISC
jgi:hypothetical protein